VHILRCIFSRPVLRDCDEDFPVCCKMCFIYKEVKSMEQSPEKLTLLLAGQELSYIVLNPTVHSHVE